MNVDEKIKDLDILEDDFSEKPILKVVGVGGAGGNAVNRMISNDVRGVEFISINTDSQDLRNNYAPTRVLIGKQTARGKGVGANAQKGLAAAIEDEEKIKRVIKDADLVFITCGFGGGTGSGAAPHVAKLAYEMGALTVCVVTKPFQSEGQAKKVTTAHAIEQIKPYCDALITIPNDRVVDMADSNTTVIDAYRAIDNVLRQAVEGISDIINIPGNINADFCDLETVIKGKGSAIMGIGIASGESRAVEAARKAIKSRLLETSIHGATDAIVHISSDTNISIFEQEAIFAEIRNAAGTDLNIIQSSVLNNDLKDEIIVTVIATGTELSKRGSETDEFARKLFEEPTKIEKKDTNFQEYRPDSPISFKEEKPKTSTSSSIPDWLKAKK